MRALFASLFLSAALFSQTAVLTYHNDNLRTGSYPAETILNTSNVNSSSFGKLFSIGVDGKADAQPLFAPNINIPGQGVHNVLYIATEHGSVYAFDANTGSQLWRVTMLKPGETPSDDRGCSQVTPEIGVTATPVIDPQSGPNGTIYVVAMSKNNSGTYFQRLHALDMTTGAEQFGGPVDVHATYPGTGDNSANGTVVFDPKQYKERPGLLLLNGLIYTAWSSHCDIRPYTGWIISYDKSSLAQVSVLNIEPNGSETSIWQSGAGMAADAGGNIFFLAANGDFDTTLNGAGFPSRGDFGNAFMKLSTANNQLAVADYFATFDTVSRSSVDADLGSGGALALPDLRDAQGNVRHLAVGAGKDSTIWIVDRDNMGKWNPNNNNQVYQQLPGVISPVWSMPAFFNNVLYYGAVGDFIKAIPFSGGMFASTFSSKSATSFVYPGATPGVSSNGTANGIVWAMENSNPAVLHAYDASNLTRELYNSNQAANSRDHFGAGNKFITPTIANGKVYAPANVLASNSAFVSGTIGVFGLMNCTYSLSSSGASVGSSGASGTVTLTTGAGCQWSSINNSGFVTLAPTSGTGSATISYSVGANNGVGRTAILVIAGQQFTITQSGAGSASQIRVFRNGLWYVDLNGNHAWDNTSGDAIFNFGVQGDFPVMGDWDGSGQLKMGIYRDGFWFVDASNNSGWDGAPPDKIFNFGVQGDLPIVGDWDGSGHLKIGVYRNGFWYVDINGNNAWDGAGMDAIFNFGVQGDIPIVGDWDGSGHLKIGVYRNGLWFVDMNGNNAWDGAGMDAIFNFGVPGDIPVVGDWDGSGRLKIGVYRDGLWYVDWNGNNQWDGTGPGGDKIFNFGVAGDKPVVAR